MTIAEDLRSVQNGRSSLAAPSNTKGSNAPALRISTIGIFASANKQNPIRYFLFSTPRKTKQTASYFWGIGITVIPHQQTPSPNPNSSTAHLYACFGTSKPVKILPNILHIRHDPICLNAKLAFRTCSTYCSLGACLLSFAYAQHTIPPVNKQTAIS